MNSIERMIKTMNIARILNDHQGEKIHDYRRLFTIKEITGIDLADNPPKHFRLSVRNNNVGLFLEGRVMISS